jgi:hypothetical protein
MRMAGAAKPKTAGVTITTDGLWRCETCSRATTTTPVCGGAHDDGLPSCGKAVCAHCADRCTRCRSYLCPDCFHRSKQGSLCVHCPPPPDGRQAYVDRQRAQAAYSATTSADERDWRVDSTKAHKASAAAQESFDDALRKADEIERQIEDMKARLRKQQESAKREKNSSS